MFLADSDFCTRAGSPQTGTEQKSPTEARSLTGRLANVPEILRELRGFPSRFSYRTRSEISRDAVEPLGDFRIHRRLPNT